MTLNEAAEVIRTLDETEKVIRPLKDSAVIAAGRRIQREVRQESNVAPLTEGEWQCIHCRGTLRVILQYQSGNDTRRALHCDTCLKVVAIEADL